MFKLKKIVDERQELELLKIEKMGFWTLYWLLLASIVIQSMFMHMPSSQFAGEFVVFMIASFYVIVACIQKGQWDYYSQPSLKNYVLYSLVGATLFSVLLGASKYMQYANVRNHFWTVGLPLVGIVFVFMFALIFVAMAGAGHMVNKRRKKLEQAYDLEQDQE